MPPTTQLDMEAWRKVLDKMPAPTTQPAAASGALRPVTGPGAMDYLQHGAHSFMQSVGQGAGALPRAASVFGQYLPEMDPNAPVDSTTQAIIYNMLRGPSGQPEDSGLYQMGDIVAKGIGDLGPAPVPALRGSFLAETVPSAAGSVVTTALPALIPVAGPAIALASGAAQQGVSEYEQARRAGASVDDATKTFMWNLPIGATDAITGLVGRGVLSQAAKKGAGSLIGNTLKGAATEALQEGGQQALSNQVAQEYYDPWTTAGQGVLESMGAGGIVGGGTTGGLHAVGRALGGPDAPLARTIEQADIDSTLNTDVVGPGTDVESAPANAGMPIDKSNMQIVGRQRVVGNRIVEDTTQPLPPSQADYISGLSDIKPAEGVQRYPSKPTGELSPAPGSGVRTGIQLSPEQLQQVATATQALQTRIDQLESGEQQQQQQPQSAPLVAPNPVSAPGQPVDARVSQSRVGLTGPSAQYGIPPLPEPQHVRAPIQLPPVQPIDVRGNASDVGVPPTARTPVVAPPAGPPSNPALIAPPATTTPNPLAEELAALRARAAAGISRGIERTTVRKRIMELERQLAAPAQGGPVAVPPSLLETTNVPLRQGQGQRQGQGSAQADVLGPTTAVNPLVVGPRNPAAREITAGNVTNEMLAGRDISAMITPEQKKYGDHLLARVRRRPVRSPQDVITLPPGAPADYIAQQLQQDGNYTVKIGLLPSGQRQLQLVPSENITLGLPAKFGDGNSVFTREAKDRAIAEFGRKIAGKLYSNPLEPIYDPEVWKQITQIAGYYAEGLGRAGKAAVNRSFRTFTRALRTELNKLSGKQKLGDVLVSADGGRRVAELWAQLRKPYYDEVKATAKFQREVIAPAYREGRDAAKLANKVRGELGRINWSKTVHRDVTARVGKVVPLARYKSLPTSGRLRTISQASQVLGGPTIDEDILQRLAGAKENLERLRPDDLQSVLTTLRALQHASEQAVVAHAGTRAHTVKTAAANIIKEINKHSPRTRTTDPTSGVSLRYIAGAAHRDLPTVIARMVGGGDTTLKSVLWDAVESADDAKLRHINDYNAAKLAVDTAHGMDSKPSEADFHQRRQQWDLGGGTVLTMTPAEFFDLYMTTKMDDTAGPEALTTGGFVEGPIQSDTSKVRVLTPAQLRAVDRLATPYMRALAPVMFKAAKELYAPVNAAVTEQRGTGIGNRGDKHWPLSRTQEQEDSTLPSDLRAWAGDPNLIRSGVIQPRLGGSEPLRIQNGLVKFRNFLERETAIAYHMVPASIAESILSQPDVKTAVIKKYGPELHDQLIATVKGNAGAGYRDNHPTRGRMAGMVRTLASNYALGRLAFRVSSVMQQASGLALAAAEMSPTELAYYPIAITEATTKPYISDSDAAKYAHNEYLRFRTNEQAGHGQTLPTQTGLLDVARGRAFGWVRELQELGMKPLGWGDNRVTAAIWNTVEHATPRGPRENDTAYYTRIGKRVASIVRTTQNAVRPLDMSHLQQAYADTPFGPLIFMFTSSQSKLRNVLDRGLAEGGTKAAQATTAATASLLAATLIGVAHGVAVYGLRDKRKDEKEVLRDRLLSRAATDAIGALAPGFGNEAADLVATAITGEPRSTNSGVLGGAFEAGKQAVLAVSSQQPKAGQRARALLRAASEIIPIFGGPSYPLEVTAGIVKQTAPEAGGGSSRSTRRGVRR